MEILKNMETNHQDWKEENIEKLSILEHVFLFLQLWVKGTVVSYIGIRFLFLFYLVHKVTDHSSWFESVIGFLKEEPPHIIASFLAEEIQAVVYLCFFFAMIVGLLFASFKYYRLPKVKHVVIYYKEPVGKETIRN